MGKSKEEMLNRHILFKPSFKEKGRPYYLVNCPFCKIRYDKVPTFTDIRSHLLLHGLDVVQCESGEIMYPDKAVYDHKGKAYPTERIRAEAYGKNMSIMRQRMSRGYTLEQALEEPIDESKRNKKFRIGETRTASCGLKMEITEYNNATDITVRFEDGMTRTGVSYDSFSKGLVAHPTKSLRTLKRMERASGRTNMTVKAHNGMTVTLIESIDYDHNTVRFEDGVVREGVKIDNFLKGSIEHPSVKSGKAIICVELGKSFHNIRQAAKETGANASNIGACCMGKIKTSGGYHWRYDTDHGKTDT